jgi:hypothetical protein
MNTAVQQKQEAFEAIDRAASAYAGARDELRQALLTLREEIARVSDTHRPGIIAALDQAVNTREHLRGLIDAHRAVFDHPKSQQLHGIKVGLRKQPGKLTFGDEHAVIQLIRKKLPSKADGLIQVSESIVAAAVKALPANELAAIGCSITDVADEVIVDAVQGEIDKLLSAITSDAATGTDDFKRAAKAAKGLK